MEIRYFALLPLMIVASPVPAFSDETPMEIVAAAVRQSGHECNQPKSLEPDPAHTQPDEKAWILHCDNGSYNVKFKGDQGAEVSPLEN